MLPRGLRRNANELQPLTFPSNWPDHSFAFVAAFIVLAGGPFAAAAFVGLSNETVLQAARDEIWQSWRRACAQNADHPRARELFDRHKLPAFHDPFAGGGAL